CVLRLVTEVRGSAGDLVVLDEQRRQPVRRHGPEGEPEPEALESRGRRRGLERSVATGPRLGRPRQFLGRAAARDQEDLLADLARAVLDLARERLPVGNGGVEGRGIDGDEGAERATPEPAPAPAVLRQAAKL